MRNIIIIRIQIPEGSQTGAGLVPQETSHTAGYVAVITHSGPSGYGGIILMGMIGIVSIQRPETYQAAGMIP